MNSKKTINHSNFLKRMKALQEKALDVVDSTPTEELVEGIRVCESTANRIRAIIDLRVRV